MKMSSLLLLLGTTAAIFELIQSFDVESKHVPLEGVEVLSSERQSQPDRLTDTPSVEQIQAALSSRAIADSSRPVPSVDNVSTCYPATAELTVLCIVRLSHRDGHERMALRAIEQDRSQGLTKWEYVNRSDIEPACPGQALAGPLIRAAMHLPDLQFAYLPRAGSIEIDECDPAACEVRHALLLNCTYSVAFPHGDLAVEAYFRYVDGRYVLEDVEQ
jgi:hypothetical protein